MSIFRKSFHSEQCQKNAQTATQLRSSHMLVSDAEILQARASALSWTWTKCSSWAKKSSAGLLLRSSETSALALFSYCGQEMNTEPALTCIFEKTPYWWEETRWAWSNRLFPNGKGVRPRGRIYARKRLRMQLHKWQLIKTSWNQDCQVGYQLQICRWHHAHGRKWKKLRARSE